MADSAKGPALSEISHLFLTGVRERQTRGANRPVRTPPKKSVSIDLTPEEFARQSGSDPCLPGAGILSAETTATATQEPSRQAAIIIAHHLGDGGTAYVRQYARHLAARAGRVGLIEVTDQQARVICFDASPLADESASSPCLETREARRLMEAIEEMSWDVQRWLIYPGDGPRTPHSRHLLSTARHCILLSTADHDGVIACYRTLKGLADMERPELSLAVVNAKTAEEADGVYRKLSGVTQQFLNRHLESEGQVIPAQGVAEHVVMIVRVEGASAGVLWSALMPWVSGGESPAPMPAITEEPVVAEEAPVEQEARAVVVPPPPPLTHIEKPSAEIKFSAAESKPSMTESKPSATGEKPMSEPVAPMAFVPAEPNRSDASLKLDFTDVMDLPGPDASAESILSAVTQQAAHWIQCPIHPPMCPMAKVCVGRDGRLMLLAVAGKGLRELRSIGLAFRWAAENRPLIKMALPQLAIDATAMPTLKLFVDHADLSADILEPMLQSGNVTVQAYRKLRWGARTGLMLEAA